MKWHCRKAQRFGVLAAYRELTSKQETWLAYHKANCSACRAFLDDIQSTLASIPATTNRSVGGAFLDNLWSQVMAGLSTTSFHAPGAIRWRIARDFPAALLEGRRVELAVTVAVALVLVGILIGRHLSQVSVEQKLIADQQATQVEAERQLIDQIHRTREYLDRTRTLLLGIVNREPASADSIAPEIRKERDVSRRLVSEGRALRAELTGDHQGLQRLLIEEIEALLLQLTNLEEYHAVAEIKRIQNSVEQRGIFLKIAIEEMKIAEQAERVSAPGTGLLN